MLNTFVKMLGCAFSGPRVIDPVGHPYAKATTPDRKEAERVAAKAKADMERNEKAWNLAEKLIGMRRNEFGALVPVNTVEPETDKSCACVTEDGLSHCHGC